MKKILLVIGALFTSQVFSLEPSFCSNPTMSYQSGCTSTCAAIAASGNFTMSSNNYGVCMGKATRKILDVRKIDLGRLEVGNESRCNIWEGDDMKIDEASDLAKLTSNYPILLSKCSVGTTYDALYITLGRYEENAGEAVFPDGSGKKVRTTSTYSGKDSAHTNYLSVASWRDIGTTNPTMSYMIPNSTSPAWVHKKLNAIPSDVDLTTSTNETMIWDRLKSMHSTYTNTVARPGYLCFSNPDGSGLDVNDCVLNNNDDTYTTIVPGEFLPGLPLTLKSTDEKLDFEYIVLKTVRGGLNKFHGTQFIWYMDGSILKYVGIQPAEAEGDYEPLIISNVGPK